jgi:hypothetical protein
MQRASTSFWAGRCGWPASWARTPMPPPGRRACRPQQQVGAARPAGAAWLAPADVRVLPTGWPFLPLAARAALPSPASPLPCTRRCWHPPCLPRAPPPAGITAPLPPPVTMGACRALAALADDGAAKAQLEPLVPSLVAALARMLGSATEDTLHLVLETLSALLRKAPQVCGPGAGGLWSLDRRRSLGLGGRSGWPAQPCSFEQPMVRVLCCAGCGGARIAARARPAAPVGRQHHGHFAVRGYVGSAGGNCRLPRLPARPGTAGDAHAGRHHRKPQGKSCGGLLACTGCALAS